MTPKEKAEELLDKYIVVTPMYLSEAKQCALIAVDELIKETNSSQWQEVRNELEKL